MQRISLILGAMCAIGLIVGISHWSSERDFQPLYSNLTPEDASAVVTKVRENGTALRLAEGGTTVLVPSAKVAETRLQLAGAGIPHSGRIGFELFDKTNFNTSDFAEQVNYHRALEGELERSMMSIAEIDTARVHLTFPKDSIYLESKQPAKASVLVKLRPGAKLSPQNVAAICQLTASAVEGLTPEGVSVVDMHGNLLHRPRPTGAGEEDTSEAALEYRQKIERDLLTKINTTLEPLLGADKFRAAVLADCDLTSGEQSEETFDPAKSVMVTSQKTDDMSGAGSQATGIPGSASTLPRPVSRPGGGANNVSRRTESIAYQSSRVVRHMKLPQGSLKKISVSLLIDNSVRWEGTGAKAKKVVEPPTAEKLKRIHDLLVAVIGFSQERGDQLVVDSLPFESTTNATQPVAESPAPAPAHPDTLGDLLKNKPVVIGAAVAAGLVVLLLGVVVILLRRGKGKVNLSTGQAQVSGAAAPALDISKQIEAQMAERENLKKQQENEALNALKASPVTTKKAEVLVKHIAEQSKKDASGLASAVRSWIGDPKKQ